MENKELEKIIIEYSIYNEYPITYENYNILESLIFQEITLDSYCMECDKESTFKSIPSSKSKFYTKKIKNFQKIENEAKIIAEDNPFSADEVQEKVRIDYLLENFWSNTHPFNIKLSCQREKNHTSYFCFHFKDNKIFKIGQYPSTASIEQVDLQKYRKILGKDKYREFNTAVGLASHGVGIGSFVYLRRIFEGLIEESHLNAMKQTDWDEEQFKQLRMNERIKMLEDYLPEFLVENRSLYGILSKGIHELEDEVCLGMYPSVKAGIEIILDQKIYNAEKEKKLRAVGRAIQDSYQKYK